MVCGTPAEPGRPLPPRPTTERRLTSVLFGDLVSFTTLSEERDPEEVRELLSGYFERCRTVVARYGGTIEKFIGDAVMAVWGVPTTHEDDAERAVRAGVDIVEAVGEYGQRCGVPDLAMRLGIVTGEVAVTLGATAEGMVAGDAVNTAARVQGAARPGTVWIDGPTRQLTRHVADTSAQGPHQLKGKAEPVELFEVVTIVGATSERRRLDRVEAPLIGRRGELALMRESLHAVADDGLARLLLLSGGAGLGKSRLARELETYADGLPFEVRWQRGRCLSYGDGVAFSALSAAVRSFVGADDEDELAEVTAKVTSAVTELDPPVDHAWLIPRMTVLLSGDVERTFTRESLFAAWVAWFDALACGDATVVWAIEDAHHADAGLLDFLEHLVGVVKAPLLVLVAARPDLAASRSDLVTGRRAVSIALEELPTTTMAVLVARLVPGLPHGIAEQLVARAEGVPLYAVEMVRTMRDRGLLVDSDGGAGELADGVAAEQLLALPAPTGLQILISSRLDALDPDERALLAMGSVLGLSFSIEGLSMLSGRPPAALTSALASLVRRDMVRTTAGLRSAEHGEYMFVQNLVRQVAYRTQSRRDRAERHLVAADYLQGLPEASGQLTSIIAQHLGDALDLLPASDPRRSELADRLLVWLENAAQRARSVGALREALANWDAALARTDDAVTINRIRLDAATVANTAAYFEQTIDYTDVVATIRPKDHDLDVDLVVRMLAQRSRALRFTGRAAQARALVEPWIAVVDGLTAAAGSGLLRELAAGLHQLGRLGEAGPIAERAVRLAEASADPELIVLALNVLANGLDDAGLPRVGVAVYRSAADLARTHDLLVALNTVLGNLAAVELHQDPRAGVESCREAIELATRIGHTHSVVGAALNLAEMLRCLGRWDELTDLLHLPAIEDAAIDDVLEVQGLVTNVALVQLARGERPDVARFALPALDEQHLDGYEAALVPFRHAIDVAPLDVGAAFELAASALRTTYERHGLAAYFTLIWPVTIDWAIDAGRLDAAQDLLELVVTDPERATPVLRVHATRLQAFMATGDATSDPADTEAALAAAAAVLDAIGFEPDLARTHSRWSAWLARRGRHADAESHREVAAEILSRLGARAWLDA